MRLRFASPAPALRRFLSGNLADAPVRPCWALPEILSVHPQSPAVTAPVGHAAPLLSAGTCAASVPLRETSLTLRCGPVGPSHLNPQSPCGDNPVGACGSASLRRHLRCFGFPAGNLADAPVRPCWALPILIPSHFVTAPC